MNAHKFLSKIVAKLLSDVARTDSPRPNLRISYLTEPLRGVFACSSTYPFKKGNIIPNLEAAELHAN